MAEIEPAEEHIALHLLDQLAAEGGLLDSEQRQSIEKHLSDCSHCRERLESIRKQRLEYLRDHPAEEFYKKVVRQAQDSRPVWYRQSRSLAVAAGILAALVTVGLLWMFSDRQDTPKILAKGEGQTGFTVVLVDKQRSYHKARQITLQPGDRIHLQPVFPEGYAYLTVFSVEASGSVSKLFERKGTDAGTIPGLEVDDSPGPDHLVLVYSRIGFLNQEDLERLDKEMELRVFVIRVDKKMPG
jgi:hypothetical protein